GHAPRLVRPAVPPKRSGRGGVAGGPAHDCAPPRPSAARQGDRRHATRRRPVRPPARAGRCDGARQFRGGRNRDRGGPDRLSLGRPGLAHGRGHRQQGRQRLRRTRMTDEIVGIDLGTTNSEIAIYRNGRPDVLGDEQGRVILPSVVGLSETGALLVGEEARNQFLLYPERTVRSIKRRMGSDDRVRLGERDYTPQEISAIILSRLKEIAQHRGKRILVYDLGGGTFDVSVVRIEAGVVEVISSHGNNHLGGDDFDRKIVEHVLEHLKLKHGVDVSGQPRAMARILRSAETAKKHLSDHPYARIEEEYLAESDGKPINLDFEVSRDDYEDMITPF